MLHVMKKAAIFASVCLSSYAQAEAIEDNSFLLEEAYNQEAGIVQFIQTFEKNKLGKDYDYSLSVEVPAPNQTHQLSFSVPYSHMDTSPNAIDCIGDLSLNYRNQLIESESVALAARISLLLPTGDEKKGLGSGVNGLQTNWAFSAKINPSFVTHMNVGATYLPGVNNVLNKKNDLYGSNSALSIIWLASDTFNLLTEFVHSSMQSTDAPDSILTESLINPGFRYAINFSNAQMVLGASVPTPVLYSKGSESYMAYLSYEPKLW